MADPRSNDPLNRSGGSSNYRSNDPLARSGGASTPASSGGGRGFFGTIGHDIAATTKGFEKKAVGLGPGLYQLGKANAEDVIHGQSFVTNPAAFVTGKSRLGKIARATPRQVANDFVHPHGDFSGAILDIGSLASLGAGTGARVAEAGRVASAGEGAAATARALTRGPLPEARFVTAENGAKVPAGVYSRAASSRAVQKGLDKIRENNPKLNARRIGKQRSINERYRARIANFDNHALAAKAKGLNKAQQFSIGVVADRVPLADRLAKADADLQRVKAAPLTKKFTVAKRAKQTKMLQNHIRLLKQTQTYVHDVDGFPVLKEGNKRLAEVYEHAKRVANKRTADLVASGHLPEDVAKAAEGRVAAHFNIEHAPEAFDQGFFHSYRVAKNPKRLGLAPQTGVKNQVGIPQPLSEVKHAFEGKNIDVGNVNPKVVEQVAADSQRANKFLSVWRQRKELQGLSKEERTSEHDIPIRPIWMGRKAWPQDIRHAIDGLSEDLKPDEQAKLAEKIHKWAFPDANDADVTTGNVKWIDSRYLGRMNEPATLGPVEGGLRVIDKVNQAERAAILIKPGYVLPNLVNNLFLNVVQQGPKAVSNIATASRIAAKLGKDSTAKIDALMGEGSVAAIGKSKIPGPAQAQAGLAKLVDVVPRRAAFLHEAHRFGYKTPAQIDKLLNDPKLEDELVRVGREANGEIIDYSRLGPAEQALVRRVLFLYPWVKGATVYGGRFLREHPVQAGVYGQIGNQGDAFRNKTLGDLPSYAQGLIGVGNNKVVNTEPLNNFPQATQTLGSVVGAFSGNPTQKDQVLGQLTPLLQAILDQGARKNVLKGLYQVPPEQLIEQLIAPNTSDKKVYPQSRTDAVLRYLIGSPAPRRINLDAAHSQAARERSGR